MQTGTIHITTDEGRV